MSESTAQLDHAPLFSPRFVWKVTAGIAALCVLTIAISAAGRMFGQSMILAGHTEDTTLHQIVIGTDVLEFPANVIRFEDSRRDGVQEAIDTYFVWPGMRGYSEETRAIFDQTNSADGLIFAQVTQATMSRDMSGRYEPIYKRIVEGSPVPGPAGLVSYRIRSDAGYSSELLYVDEAGGLKPYVVRCLIEDGNTGAISTQTGCQRDVFIGQDLSLTYRFSIDLLPHWREIESDVRARFDKALGKPASTAENG